MSKRSIIKWIVTITTCGLVFAGTSFAQPTEPTVTETSVNLFYNIVLFLSRSWSIFAIIAGKLMTNDLILGGVFHLDIWLWRIWNIMKNFANFALGLLFLYFVIKSLLSGKDDAKALIVTKLKGFILAGVLIQASRFVTVAMIDLSTILTTSFGSLPSIFIADNGDFAQHFKDAGSNLRTRPRFIFETDPNSNELHIRTEDTGEPVEDEELLDFIMPSNKTLSGPLLFLGVSIFSFQDTTLYDYNTLNSGSAALITILMNFGITLMYAVALLLLVIVNVVRVGFIWILIAGAPIFALLWGLKRGGVLEKDPLDSKVFSPSTLIELIFIPVRVVVFLSLILIFAVAMRRLMTDPQGLTDTLDQNYETQIENNLTGSVLVVSNITEQTVQGDIFKDIKSTTQNTIADLVVFIFSLVLIWILIKLSFPSGNAITGKITEGFFKQVEAIAASTPIIPLPGGGGKKIGVSYINRLFDKAKGDYLQTTFGTRRLDDLDARGKERFDDRRGERLGMEKRDRLYNDERIALEMATRATQGNMEFINQIGKSARGLQNGFSINDSQRKTLLHNWLKNRFRNKSEIQVSIGGKTVDLVRPSGRTGNDMDNDIQAFFNQGSGTGSNAYRFHQLLKEQGLYETRVQNPYKYADIAANAYRGNQTDIPTQTANTQQQATTQAQDTEQTTDEQTDNEQPSNEQTTPNQNTN